MIDEKLLSAIKTQVKASPGITRWDSSVERLPWCYRGAHKGIGGSR